MRLDFNVLWVEDQQDAVESQRDRIRQRMRGEGFRLEVLFAATVEEATNRLKSDIYGDHIDLVLMDYDLGPGKKGDEGLEEVRNVFEYKDIIFYSARADDLRNMVAERRVSGVFCSSRQDLVETVIGVFSALVKKVVDIDHSRGIVLGAACEIDGMVEDSLISLYEAGDRDLQEVAHTEIRRRFEDNGKQYNAAVEKVDAMEHLNDIIPLHRWFGSNDRLRLLLKVLRGSVDESLLRRIKAYMTETVPRRNDLAHRRVIRQGFARRLVDGKGVEMTSDQMRDLRVTLLESEELFLTVLEHSRPEPQDGGTS